MPCPFLTRFGQNYVKTYAPLLVKTYGNQCPVISRALTNDTKPESQVKSDSSETNVAPCPFLNKVKNVVKPTIDNDTIEIKSDDLGKSESKPVFPYETFFHDQIIKKKREHSYRIFKKVNRLAGPGQFPKALEYTWGEKPITVWCSNDYLGMSCHPEVKNAVR